MQECENIDITSTQRIDTQGDFVRRSDPHSQFRNEQSRALYQTNNSGYGGVLSCVDCPSLEIFHCSVFNVSAGLIMIISTNYQQSIT